MENISDTKHFLLPFHVQKGHFYIKNYIFFSEKSSVLEQKEQRHKKHYSKVGVKANEKGSQKSR